MSKHLLVSLHPVDGQEGKTPSPSIRRQASMETDRVSKDFQEFLKHLRPGREIHKQCRAFIESMANKKVSGVGGSMLFE